MTDTIVTFAGSKYRLINDAEKINYRNEAIDAAPAIAIVDGAEPGEYGISSWSVHRELPEVAEDDMPDSGDIADVIDWDHPSNVIPYGGLGNQYSYDPSTATLG